MQTKSTFRQFVSSTSNNRTGEVTLLCPKCHKVVRAYDTEVNSLNEWAFKSEYAYDPQAGRSRVRYSRVDYDGRGCCY